MDWKGFCFGTIMKFRILFAVIIISVYTTACKSEKAKKYSDLIVSKEQSLENDIVSATTKLQVYFISDQTDSIVSLSTRMEDQINAALTSQVHSGPWQATVTNACGSRSPAFPFTIN